ncbi:MAG: hypothetical protein Ct9H300mP4_14730 [Gammaproteobacteria bacterium]|nr:MAG: hypothetical protein Ct9H300mP4_14730 [Gammaproteobacteria bacterium]
MKKFSPILQDLIEAFKQLPGIGLRVPSDCFHLLQDNTKKLGACEHLIILLYLKGKAKYENVFRRGVV